MKYIIRILPTIMPLLFVLALAAHAQQQVPATDTARDQEI